MASNSKGKALVRPEGAGDKAGVHASSKKSAAEAAAASIPVSKVKCEYDCSDTRFLIENSSNFKRSGPPVRLMGYVDESWDDFPFQVVNSVRKGFVEGMPVVEVGIGGVRYLFDLYRMLHVDLESGSWRSIAWIDVHGKCFFPKTFVGAPEGVRNVTGERRIEVVGVSKSPDVEILNVNAANDLANSEILKIEIGIKIADNWDFSKKKRVCVEIGPEEDEKLITEGHSVNENFLGVKRLRIATNDVEVESPKWPKAKKLVEGARAYNRVRNLFLSGIGDFEPFITITAIHQWLTGPAECARCKVFYKQTEITKASRGDAKLSYAWYGTSAKGVENVLSHGFGMPSRVPASEIHGIGIYLSALSFPLFSGRLSEDDNGEKHVILCEVILGKCEKVQAGSSQLYPSSKDFDTGVDDLKNPKWFSCRASLQVGGFSFF
ncbi:probable inactive poly [ADP-ribose] polymerase SRO1 isoform X2 [Diospyros lotus]|uniref:probable inactive poly [ADP-ribose] polymerase SRO1 isoform X2 n=1 Tax=Diospyros lotus TaxID=55363 RepID=UPI00224CC04A|nr:probable inactive poly [ADP-ribose] polymerase SRO1 isoform X2 [Diospyros lotus]